MRYIKVGLCLIASGILSDAAAQAQQSGVIETVVVTAEKRQQSINDVGMSITAVTGDVLKARAIVRPSDLVAIEPSLQVAQSSAGTAVYLIRGVGYYDQSLSATPAVSLYQNEVPLTYPVFSRGAMLDMDHVEILKGPQGTLFGQNATGGAINFVPAAPTDTFAAGADVSYGSFNAADLDGFVSGPITDTLNARLAAETVQGGAWQKSVTRNVSTGNQDTFIGRLLLDWAPTDDFKARLSVNGWADNSEPQESQLEGVWFQNPQYIAPIPPADLNNPVSHLPNPADYSTYPVPIQKIVSEPIMLHNDRTADWDPSINPKNDERFYQLALRMDYTVSAALGFTSITSYEHYTQADRRDTTGTQVTLTGGLFGGSVDSFYQELRAHGVVDDGRVNWLFGGNYGLDHTSEVDNLHINTSNSYLAGGSLFSPFPTPPGAPFNYFTQQGTVKAITGSVYGNVDYNILPELTLHGGIRFTVSDQTMTGCSFTPNFVISVIFNGVPPGACVILRPDGTHGTYTTSLNQTNVPWRVGVDWKPSDNALLYVSVSRGFKAGGVPVLAAITYQALQPVKQEELLAYEIGFKTQWFDNTLQLNGAAFYYDYTDKQLLGRIVEPIFGDFTALVNIPKSREEGAELSALWLATPNLTLNAAATYVNSEVTSSFENFATVVLNPTDMVNFKGEAFPFTPNWALNAGARYEQPLTGDLTGFVGLTGSYQSKTVAAFGASHLASILAPPVDIKAYGLLNFTAGVETTDGHWQFEVWGKNITDTYYWNAAYAQNDVVTRLTGMPATFGVSVKFRN